MDAKIPELIATQDAVILGRRSYNEWAQFWPSSQIEPFATFINGVEKYVATSTPLDQEWANSTVVDGGLVEFVRDLKHQPGRDIGVHGSISVAQALLAADVVDYLIVDYRLIREGRRTSQLARHAAAKVGNSRAECAGLDQFEIHPAPALGKERNATANQHRVDPGPVLVDQTQRGRLGGESRAADRDVALPRLGSQPLDLLRQAAGGQAGIALHRRQRGGEHHLWERLPDRGPLEP